MQERRSTNRWCVNRPCGIKLEGRESFTSCTLRDISLKGMQLGLENKLSKDTFVKLTLFCNENYILDVEVWIVWERSVMGAHYYGFYFSMIKDSDRQRIYKFINECCPELMVQCWWKGVTEEKGGSQMEDRRIFDRIPVKFPLRFLEPASGNEGQGRIWDISAKGIGLVSSKGVTRKTDVEMWIEIPDRGEPLYTRGEVVWSQMLVPDQFRIGVNLDKADFMGLSRILRVAE
jgi:c-di-GMP-binding flagellar brake protein YcgR